MLTWREAGRLLAERVASAVSQPPVIVAVSACGATIASEVAHALGAPLDLLASARLAMPGRPHSIFGAVTDSEVTLLPERITALDLPSEYVDHLVEVARREVLDRSEGWRGAAPAIDVWGRAVILVDDGRSEADALTTAASVLRQAGASEVIFAAPTAAADLSRALVPACPRQILLQPPGTSFTAMVCGPAFPQATRMDVRAMTRRSGSDLVAAPD